MVNWPVAICGVLGFLVSWTLIPIILKRSQLNGVTRERSFHHTHETPVTRLGGIALATAFLAIAGVILIIHPRDGISLHTRILIVISSLAIFGIGLRDDVKPLGARKKLLAQIVIALAVYAFGIQIETFRNPITGTVYHLGMWGALPTTLWLVAMTNLINLIDGIDGLAGGISLMLMCLLAYVGSSSGTVFPILCSVGMCGALVGFLIFNFPPAKVYMGDGGAYLLGFLIGILTIVNSQKGTVVVALIAPLFALALPILDVALAILRRGLKGLPIFRPDRKHLHHRLVEFGFSRRRTVLTLYGVSLLFLVLGFGVAWSRGQLVPIMFGVLFLTLILSARSFGFTLDWLAVGIALGNSLQMRKETRYVLALSRWLELEAERIETLHGLWVSFLFIAYKLGFSEVTLFLDNGEQIRWQSKEFPLEPALQRSRQDLRLANIKAVEFASESAAMSNKLLEHFSELSSEAWLKAAQRWQALHGTNTRFEALLPSENTPLSPGKIALLKGAI